MNTSLRKIILFYVLFSVAFFASCKKVGHIHGTVKDAETGELLENVKVEISPGGMVTLTNSIGEFTFADLDEGLYSITVSKTGYQTTTKDFTVNKRSTTRADFSLLKYTPTITVTSPSSIDVWQKQTQKVIRWDYSDITGNVKIELYNNGIVEKIIDDETECDGSYNWSIPSDIPDGNYYKIKITALDNSAIYDASDYFAIQSAPEPEATTLQPSDITYTSAQLNAKVQPNDNTCTISFEFGTTTDYGNTVEAIPSTLSGSNETNVYANITNLQPNTEYHYRVVVTFDSRTIYGADITFSTPAEPNLTEYSVNLQYMSTTLDNDMMLVTSNGTTEGGSSTNGDVAFVWQASYGYSLCSPDAEWISDLYSYNGITYTTSDKKHTKIMALTGVSWDTINANYIENLNINEQTIPGGGIGVNNLSIGDIIAFETNNGVKGVIKINAQSKVTTDMQVEVKQIQ